MFNANLSFFDFGSASLSNKLDSDVKGRKPIEGSHREVVGAAVMNSELFREGGEKTNLKLTAYQAELAQVEAEIGKLPDMLTGANAALLAYANKKIKD